jgi:hypothetical protein
MTQTMFLLMAQHEGRAVVPLDEVAKVHFALTEPVLWRKIRGGEIKLPVIEMEASQKGAKGVHLGDLAAYIDQRRVVAQKIAS